MADDNNNVTTLGEDQMSALAKMVTEQILKSQSNQNDDDGETKQDKPTGKASQLTPEQIADAVFAKIESNTSAENKKVYETLWNEKFNQTVSSTPGLKDFIDSEDDYGDTRAERLKNIESYEDRINALNKLANSFKEASAGKPGRRPIVNKAAEKKAKEAEDTYAELQKKSENGEYQNTNQMTNDFFAAIAKEIEGIA